MDGIVEDFSEAAGLQKRSIRFTYYLILVLIHTYFMHWSYVLFPVSIFVKLCYLTNISFYTNFVYYIYIFLLHTPLQKYIKNITFLRGLFKFAYTLSFVVFILYWGMILANPNLLKRHDYSIPLTFDFFLHGANFIFNLIEHIYVLPRQNSDHVSYKFYVIFLMIYGSFLQLLYFLYNMAVYPFVATLSILQFLLVLVIAVILLIIGDYTYKLLLKKHYKNI